MKEWPLDGRIARRRLLQLAAGGAAWWLAGPLPTWAQSGFAVGVGRVGSSVDAYAATRRAVETSGGWSASTIAGRTVVVKPNLVTVRAAETGTITDPQVVRAVVDLALEAGAAKVQIVEYADANKYAACGYGFFQGYVPNGRVELVDLTTQPVTFTQVRGSMAYLKLYLPTLLLGSEVFFISAAKLKTHVNALASLSMKNLFGLPPIQPYQDSPVKGRFAMHKRSVSQTTIDLNLARPIDFAIVDGVWGMEGNGPLDGTPVQMNMVVAGRNALAVDRVAASAMGIGATAVQHLEYAARKGLGPAALNQIQILGDTLPTHPFVIPPQAPTIEFPKAAPAIFAPRQGQQTQITYGLDVPSKTRVEIVRTADNAPGVSVVRLLHDWQDRAAGAITLPWDGRNNAGQTVPASLYSIRVHAIPAQGGRDAYATGAVIVS